MRPMRKVIFKRPHIQFVSRDGQGVVADGKIKYTYQHWIYNLYPVQRCYYPQVAFEFSRGTKTIDHKERFSLPMWG